MPAKSAHASTEDLSAGFTSFRSRLSACAVTLHFAIPCVSSKPASGVIVLAFYLGSTRCRKMTSCRIVGLLEAYCAARVLRRTRLWIPAKQVAGLFLTWFSTMLIFAASASSRKISPDCGRPSRAALRDAQQPLRRRRKRRGGAPCHNSTFGVDQHRFHCRGWGFKWLQNGGICLAARRDS